MTSVNFLKLAAGAGGKPGGRLLFAQLVIDLVHLQHPSVRDVLENPGDWGIDGYVGSLDGGTSVLVWQAKYFIDGVKKAQQGQITESFDRCMKAAKENGFEVTAWTLCVPESMDGATSQWWGKWRKKMEAEHELIIDLWEPTKLRALLRAPEAKLILDEYFGDGHARPRGLEPVPTDEEFSGMLFIKQLLAADIDPASARYEFFNAELLRQETLDKLGAPGRSFLDSVQEELFGMWHQRWAAYCAREAGNPLLPGLHSDVMTAIEQLHSAPVSALDAVPMRLPHRKGAMHQVVETGRAGWIRAFQRIAEEHGV
jgi:hypothetical protein